jgi:hypothetical protein
MRAVPTTLLIMALACHPPFPDSALPEGDTDTDADADSDTDADGDVDNPPVELCQEGDSWGDVETELTLEQDGKILHVDSPSDATRMYEITGQADLCEIDCSPTWLNELYITDSKLGETVSELPLRMGKDDLYYAYFRVNPPEGEGGETEHCYVETSAGTYWLEIQIGD